MNNIFPLYDIVSTNIPNRDLTVLQKKELIKNINEFNTEGQELIYALIRHHYFLENKNITDIAKIESNKIEFELSSLPIKLRQILFKFSTIHKNKMNEDVIKEQLIKN